MHEIPIFPFHKSVVDVHFLNLFVYQMNIQVPRTSREMTKGKHKQTTFQVIPQPLPGAKRKMLRKTLQRRGLHAFGLEIMCFFVFCLKDLGQKHPKTFDMHLKLEASKNIEHNPKSFKNRQQPPKTLQKQKKNIKNASQNGSN